MSKNTTKNKKPLSLAKRIVIWAVCGVLIIAMTVGTCVAYNYEGLLDTFFSSSEYSASEAEKQKCQDVVKEGAVLLKNEDNALPLADNEKKIAVFGQNSVDFVYGGSGSGAVDTKTAPNFKTALESVGYTVDANLWDFYDTGAGKTYRKTYPDESGRGAFTVNEVPIDVLQSNSSAVGGLSTDDVAIVTIGRSGGESSDLPLTKLSTGYMYLQVDGNERDTIKFACSKFNKVILIVNANNAIELGFLEESSYANVKAVLWCGGVGQEGMYGLASILKGETNPSGRLVDTYAYDSTSAPSFNNMGDYTIANADSATSRADKYLVYGEGIYVGYRYYETRYEDYVLGQGNVGSFDYATQVQYPFGYGLSYTQFQYSGMQVTQSADGNSYSVTVDVKNNGSYDGKDVVEVYLQKPYNGVIETSAVELVGFTKTDIIKAGESASVTVTVDKSTFGSYDYKTNKTYVLDSGDYYLAIGSDAHDALNNILAARGVSNDKMTANGNSALANNVLHQDILDANSLSKSSATGYTITNQFDDVNINYYDTSFTYLSRSNWVDTLASSADYQNKSWTAPAKLIEDLKFYRADEVINDSSLPASVNDSKSTSYTVNDLIEVDYNDSKWNDIVNQLSWQQMSKLVRIGGYSTMEITEINLPGTIDKDGPSGISGTLVGGTSCMAWPAEVVMSSTWNTTLIEEVGVKLGEDSIASGTTGWYAPGIDIHRSPYSGRNFEYFSEDGFLSGKIGAAEMRGVRSMGVIAYMKHFALNDQEQNRYGGAFFANEQAIREIFLKGFEYTTTEGHSIAVMVAMNRLGARWAGAHKGLMTEVLRNEWGFKGMAITDQASVAAMYYEDMIAGLWAGTDLWLNSNSSLWPISKYDDTIGGLSNNAVDYKNNATVNYYLHKAAKNIIYTVTNSNATQTYSQDVQNTSTVFPWRILLTVADVIIIGASAAAIAVTAVFYIKSKKPSQPE
jgi:beta-glucosidase